MTQSMETLVGNGVVLTLGDDNRVIPDGAVYVSDGTVADIGKTRGLKKKHPDAEYLDAGGRVIMPGFICAHHHLYSTFACGISTEPSMNFVEILEHLWWKLDRALGPEDVTYSALIPLARCIRSGTTTIIDHHASPGFIRGSLDRIADAVLEAGIRASLCYEVTDRNGEKGARDGINENAAFLRRAKSDKSGRLHGLVGIHASMTVGPETLDACVSAAAKSGEGVHVHVAEDKADQEHCEREYGLRVVERLKSAGALGPRSLAVHCIHVSDAEIDILRETDTIVIHNPQSNMNNAVGAARVIDMVKRGVTVGLGTDGMTSNMCEEVRAALWLQHHEHRDPRVGFVETAEMLVKTNAKVASRFFRKALGCIAIGAPADIIISGHIPFTPIGPDNVLGHIIFGVAAASVDTTIVDGRVLMRHGELKTIDWENVSRRAAKISSATWKRFAELK
ncbi:MAG: putative aminohydrolase SsnA [bacterium]